MGLLAHMSFPKTDDHYSKKLQIDFSDRLNWEITVNLLVIATLIVTNIKHFINKLISCTVPMHFSNNQEEYVNEVCFISDKYYVLDTERILIYKNDSSKFQVNYVDETASVATINTSQQEHPPLTSYYIFVPYILMIEAFLIIVPRKLWAYFLQSLTTFDVDEVLEVAHTCKNFSNKKFKKIYLNNKENSKTNFDNPVQYDDTEETDHFNFLINQIQRWTFLNGNYNLSNSFTLKRKYLCTSYLLIKLIGIMNIFFLIFLINNLLSIDLYHIFIHLIQDLRNNIFLQKNSTLANSEESFQSFYLMNSYYFPLRSMCAFKIRELVKTNVYAVMCTLPINLFNQYIFMLILIWFVVLLSFNIYYLVFWIVHFQKFSEINYVKEKLFNGLKVVGNKESLNKCDYLCHIYQNDSACNECTSNFDVFYNNFLSSDLIFFLRIMALNSNENLLQQIYVYLWKVYENEYKKKRKDKTRRNAYGGCGKASKTGVCHYVKNSDQVFF